MPEHPLGRLVPNDWDHIQKHPYQASMGLGCKLSARNGLRLPYFMPMNQKAEGACVGFGCSGMMSILNGRRYDPFWLWNEAKKIDEWAGTVLDSNPHRGTSVRAAMDVLRTQGHCRYILGPNDQTWRLGPHVCEGITENQWATTVDEIRCALYERIPVALGISWYSAFDTPTLGDDKHFWIAKGTWGYMRGGHCILLVAGDDDLEGVAFTNSWGDDYPRLTWLPYIALDALLRDSGEATLVVDRPTR
jgi:hypothetical protein